MRPIGADAWTERCRLAPLGDGKEVGRMEALLCAVLPAVLAIQ
ncbi:MAG TPA: hypothetical protein VEV61_16740 [Streptosporangiaceae bacterium]|nr:hypothetical protein [Streptosporangiaceae bacterium]